MESVKETLSNKIPSGFDKTVKLNFDSTDTNAIKLITQVNNQTDKAIQFVSKKELV